jgi:UDP-2-acetamido-2-deoxy-ribo-hexuluronate aminotransferase
MGVDSGHSIPYGLGFGDQVRERFRIDGSRRALYNWAALIRIKGVIERMKTPFYGHQRQYLSIKDEIDAKMQEVIMSGQYVQGPMLKKFEAELAAYAGTKYAIGVGNGTDALWLTYMALGLGEGDELITHANTFFATAEAMWTAGCTAVLVDCDPQTKCIDPDAVRRAITRRTKAIVPVHLYGQCAPMRAIREIADEYGLFVIEDNAQAIDARGDDFRIGELSDAACTSFIIQKNLGTFGDGGAVWTNHQYVNDRIRKLRNHGSSQRDVHSYGFNSRLDDLHAGVLSAKLRHITEWSDRRIQIAAQYTAGLRDCDFIELPYVRPGYRHVFHLYVIETRNPADRGPMLDYLVKNGVDAKTHYSIAIHQQEGFPWGKDVRLVGPLTNAERNAASCISLPMFPELTQEEIDYAIQVVRAWKK